MENKILMTCGHTANGYKVIGNRRIPCCVICDCDKIAQQTFVVNSSRLMKCRSCGRVVESNQDAAFFKFQPDEEYDSYYCGCDGWD